MKNILLVLHIIITSFLIITCNSNDTSTSTPTTGGDTVIPLSPGAATFNCDCDGIQWSDYTTNGSCSHPGDTIKIISSFSLLSNSYTVSLSISNPTSVGTVSLDSVSSSYITYDRVLYSYPEHYSTKLPGGSGQINITYFNTDIKTLKGTFYATVKEIGGSFTKSISSGTFKGTWQ